MRAALIVNDRAGSLAGLAQPRAALAAALRSSGFVLCAATREGASLDEQWAAVEGCDKKPHCGHLHRAGMTPLGEDGPLQIVAPSALSPRGTGQPNGWNLITTEGRRVDVCLREWVDGQWTAQPGQTG